MAKRKRKSTQSSANRFTWSVNESADLLAWIDHCIEKERGRDDLKQTTVEYLKRRWERDFTWERIDNRIKLIYERGHQDESKSRKDMWQKGTECLDFEWLEEEVLFGDERLTWEAIEEAKERIKEEIRHGMTGSERVATRSQSKTVSAKPEPIDWQNSGFRVDAVRNSSSQTRVLRSMSSKTPTKQLNGTSATEGRRSSRRATTVDRQPRRSQRGECFPENIGVLDSEEPEQNGEIDTSPIIDALESPRNIIPTQRDFYPESCRETSRKDDEDIVLVQQRTIEEKDRELVNIRSTNRELLTMRNKLMNENSSLVNLLASTKKDLDDKMQCWNSVRKERNHEYARFQYAQNITELRKELVECKRLARFANRPDGIADSPRAKDIIEAVESINSRCKTAFVMSSELALQIPEQIYPTTNSIDLIRRVLAVEPESISISSPLSDRMQRMTAEDFIRALVSAALNAWVFDLNWPNFDQKQSQLLRTYREHIALQEEGLMTLQSLDYAAHHSLLKESAFEEYVLPHKAEELTQRLLFVLEPFFQHETADEENRDFANQRQEEEKCIKELFQQALALKSDLLVSPDKYSLCTFHPGDPFDPQTMKIDTEHGVPSERSPISSALVKLCLFPAVLVHPSANSGPLQEDNQDLASALVQYNNFVAPETLFATKPELLTRAVVILDEYS